MLHELVPYKMLSSHHDPPRDIGGIAKFYQINIVQLHDLETCHDLIHCSEVLDNHIWPLPLWHQLR